MKNQKGRISIAVVFCLSLLIGLITLSCDDSNGDDAELTQNIYQKVDSATQRLYWRSVIGAPPDGEDKVFFWEGEVYFDIPGDVYGAPYPGAPGNYYSHGGGNAGTPAFGFIGYNIRNVVPYIDDEGKMSETDFIQASREIVFFTATQDGVDPVTGEEVKAGDILKHWKNPLTGKAVPIYPITNEYLWEHYRVGKYDEQGEYIDDGKLRSVITISFFNQANEITEISFASEVPGPKEFLDHYNWSFEIFPNYQLNDAGRWGIDDPMNLKNETYTSAELFSFWVPTSGLSRMEEEIQDGIVLDDWYPEVKGNWTRIGPWPPYLCMSEEEYEGRIVYTVQYKLLDSYEEMPEDFRQMMAEYFDPMGMDAQGMETIGLKDGDGDGWEMAPSEYNPEIKRDTSFSVFYDKVLKPENLTWEQWCMQNSQEPVY
jgi:hypothetical protein